MKKEQEMKVCHMTISDMTAIPRLYREAHSIVRKGMRCCIVAPGNSRFDAEVEMIGVPLPRNRKERLFKTDREVLKRAYESGSNIFQIHDPELLRYAIKLKKKGKIVIFDSHEFYGLQIKAKTYLPHILRNFAAWIYMKYEKIICMQIDAVIYVCTVNGKNYFEGRTRRSIMLPNYPELSAFNYTQTRIVNREGFNDKLIYAGTLSEDRGITNIALAARKTKMKLVLCGSCSSPDYLKSVLNEYSDVVEYKGVLSSQELTDEYSKAQIGLSTLLPKGQYGLIDTYPTKVLEYCWMGIPIIVSNFPVLRDLVDRYYCGICVDPNNVENICTAITFLQEHPQTAYEMGQNGRRAIEREFNWGTQEKKLIDLYEKLGACKYDKNT